MAAVPFRLTPVEMPLSTLLAGVDRLVVAVDSDLGSAGADAAVGPALVRMVAGTPRSEPPTGWLRTYCPVPTVGFSRRDSRSPGYPGAVAAVQAHGFQPAVRSPGGRAAAYHRCCLCFDLVLPDPGTRDPVQQMSALGELLAAVLRELGVDARVGEVPGEYCPGRFSVNAGGVAKIVGTAGRRIRGGILLSGSIVVADADPLRVVLSAVYPALGLTMDPRTVVAAADVGCAADDPLAIGDALISALAPAVRLSVARLPAHVAAEATTASGVSLPVG